MKNLYLVVVLFFCLNSQGFSQEKRVSVHANSGYFFHKGAGVGSSTRLLLSDVATIPHNTTSLYGNLGAVSYGLGISVQKTAAGRLIYGIEVSGESLASRQHIRSVIGQLPGSINTDEGKHVYRTSFLNFFPSIGRSINLIPRIKSTILIGPDLGIGLRSQNIYDITIKSQEWNWTYRTNGPKIDFRPRIEFVNYIG